MKTAYNEVCIYVVMQLQIHKHHHRTRKQDAVFLLFLMIGNSNGLQK